MCHLAEFGRCISSRVGVDKRPKYFGDVGAPPLGMEA